MDSLAVVEASTYTGVTPNAEPVPELAKGDTLLKKVVGTGVGGSPTRAKKAGTEKISTGTINLNTATLQDLMRLPGVGEATAEKILLERSLRRFTRIEDVMRVKGIGKKKFEAMKPFLEL
ncbi:MAG: helix-hairpin-helix domain-containing protein [Candidatus Kapaibacterium sp.]|nr:MAG: helix-hairpin-helix domain-containing protein [Candidatus Kapabacteria bacterium]